MENTVCIFDGPRKHVDLLGMNNYRTLATTQQYERSRADGDNGKQRTSKRKKPTSNDCSKRPRK